MSRVCVESLVAVDADVTSCHRDMYGTCSGALATSDSSQLCLEEASMCPIKTV